jgi:hypothetical protein
MIGSPTFQRLRKTIIAWLIGISTIVARKRTLIALICSVLALVVSVTGRSPAPGAIRAPALHDEIEDNRHGANAFADTKAKHKGQHRLTFDEAVQVSCKVFDPSITSASPDGYWYRIATPPWDNQFYAVANTFANGDPVGANGGTHNTDPAIPDC